ncbi:MAG: response regulator [Spirochaetia bacterium]|jgi:signal transduction histidine kinase/DNA-binding response OmpR family regulator|nr:response regulator [Spirochaetia bacterium]
MSKLKAFIQKYLYSEELPLEVRMLNMVYLVGIAGAFVTIFTRIAAGSNIYLILLVLAIAFSIVLMLYLANRFHLYRFSRWILIIAMCDILFPLAYFALGGITSSILGYFILSIVVIFLLAEGKSRLVFLATHILIIILCYYLGSRPRFSRFVAYVAAYNIYLDHIQALLVVGLCIGMFVVFQKHIYTIEKEKVTAARDDLFYRDRLLQVVNQAAGILLASEPEHIKKTLPRVMQIMAQCIDADRMYIWKNRLIDGKLYYVQQYEWLHQNADKPPGEKNGYFYQDSIPAWEQKFATGQIVNGPLSSLSENEQSVLGKFGIRSILVIPVFLQEKFWGFVSFDDCHRERFFTDDAIRILRSGSLLLANAEARNTNDALLNARLRQQDLMSDIAQNLIYPESLEMHIHDALRRVGEFLGATRILVVVVDKATEQSYPAYSWFCGDAWKPDPSMAGLNPLITSLFPQYMPMKGYVPTESCDNIYTGKEGKYRILEKTGLKSFLWAPVYVKGEFWGILSIEDCISSRAWSKSDTQLIALAVSAIAGAITRDLMDKERTAALEQAVRASKAKGDFLSNMSHEMRTPMNAIIGMTAIGKAAHDLEKKDYAFEKIENASSHLLGVINDILDMSKIEANKLEFASEPFNLEKMLQKVTGVVNFRITQRKQSFYVSIDKRIPHTLIGDDQRLAQIVTNLLSNAIKFTPEGGTVRLEACFVGEEKKMCTIQIRVSDTGIGISPEQQARLFNSFEQAESSTARKFGGTGLGLAISKRIVEMMGGRIWIESQIGNGAAFTFTVRLKCGEDRHKPLLDPGVNRSNIRILTVDDDEEVLKYFADIAKNFGIRCDTTGDAEDALRLIGENGGYDIYFIDWKMPGVNSLELASRIRRSAKRMSVITMISAAEWTDIEADAKTAGVDKFLSKPIFPSDIANLINECLGLADKPAPGEAKAVNAEHFGGCTILLVDDVEINREIVLALLDPTGLAIDCAETGAEALRMFARAPDKYDMVLMDIQMPEMDGYEATRRIRAMDTPRARSIPIVAMTANVFREDIEKSLESGMDDHIGKPLDFEEVLAKLRKYLPRRTA